MTIVEVRILNLFVRLFRRLGASERRWLLERLAADDRAMRA